MEVEVLKNLKWLWAAFSVAWALHIGYVLSLSSREKKLRGQLEDIRSMLREHGESRERGAAPDGAAGVGGQGSGVREDGAAPDGAA